MKIKGFESKLPNVGTTIFSVMSKMANDYNAINLSQGFPNFPVDPKLIDSVAEQMRKGHNQYAPMQGVLELREAIADKIQKLHRVTVCPENEINITAGATQAIFTIISTFVRTGDEVVIIEPAYDCYEPAIELNGGITKRVQLRQGDYSMDWQQLERQLSDQTKMLIINTPHNPTGTILKESDLQRLDVLLKDYPNVIVLSDEVYEHIIFDGEEHQSILKFPALYERSMVVYSFGKTFHVTGWKLGYVVAPDYLLKEFRKVHQFNVFTVNTPMQYAIAEYLKDEANYNELSGFYQKKRDLFLEAIKETKFKPIPTQGTYFSTLDYSAYSEKGDMDFATELTQKHGVASVPVSVFYGGQRDDKVLRFCFAKTEDMISEAVERLLKIK